MLPHPETYRPAIELIKEYQATGDVFSRNSVIEYFGKDLKAIALANRRSNGRISLDDLMQEGVLGLMRGIEQIDSFEPIKTAVGYLRQRITGFMLDYIRKNRPKSRHHYDLAGKMRGFNNSFYESNGREPSYDEMAEHWTTLRSSKKSWGRFFGMIMPSISQEFESLNYADSDEHNELNEPISREADPVDRLLGEEIEKVFWKEVNSLSETERVIFSLAATTDMTLTQIGAKVGVSNMTVKRRLDKLRDGKSDLEITQALLKYYLRKTG